ncbi:aromatic ring-hydroxylating dioxygenase subunit alpha [Burkholderia multivorans]|uniref:aromatic ring-hydroxylating oxygenase subunit alpha n=1 Tax=Burkholderia multivorans TaxID=87883 RepID=UPI000CFF3578|nr:aromatic ring-hydroxylating dioxygenase subunit alpha [Burkholderia multivorans]MBU9330628.1 aromatic ring-hydroxylating dioxygenase subunit alpha [Burkholderia multivorans]MBU9463052.1 aromatic ring-hydroxylating dioxygenase subunit alpha [Burkholderia multivorans]MBU9527911.1 aromatic ring-hydroxylating dioxygenase subunit alpha [Burkholderia multivorans]MBU9533736.1 aromatic ring-hydroxylating dioxygenase subunit alpha [Burkholderia multivorans]MBU9570585.1 aromatic ring-hydroxylating di
MRAVPLPDSNTLEPASGALVRDLRRVPIHPDYWYPLAWSRELKRGKTLGVRFAGEPIALVRTESGAVYALEDRCAHRQVPLHAGVVAGETLRCCYHGWTYDCSSGRCVDVPYLGRERLPNGVRAYPCREAHGLIFVFPGDATRADERPFPLLASADDRGYKTRRFGREVKCHYSFMHENLMDMNHQFLHRKQMGQMRARCVGRRRGDDWVEVDYTFARMEGKQPVGEALVFGSSKKPGDQANKSVMTVRTGYPYQTLQIRSSEGTLVMDLWIVYVPLDAAQRTNRTFGLLSIRKPGVPFALDLAWPLLVWFTERIFGEDRWIVEREQEAHDEQGADWNHEVFPVINELRDLLRQCGARTVIPIREVDDVR